MNAAVRAGNAVSLAVHDRLMNRDCIVFEKKLEDGT